MTTITAHMPLPAAIPARGQQQRMGRPRRPIPPLS
jgi:hypothetical protein